MNDRNKVIMHCNMDKIVLDFLNWLINAHQPRMNIYFLPNNSNQKSSSIKVFTKPNMSHDFHVVKSCCK